MLPQSFFVSDTVHERPVKLPDGQEHTLYFREVPAVEFRKFALAESSKDEDVRAGSMARLIAASLCEPSGKPALTFQKALTLKPEVMRAIFDAALDVCAPGGLGNASPPRETSGSGTSSPSPLAAEQ